MIVMSMIVMRMNMIAMRMSMMKTIIIAAITTVNTMTNTTTNTAKITAMTNMNTALKQKLALVQAACLILHLFPLRRPTFATATCACQAVPYRKLLSTNKPGP